MSLEITRMIQCDRWLKNDLKNKNKYAFEKYCKLEKKIQDLENDSPMKKATQNSQEYINYMVERNLLFLQIKEIDSKIIALKQKIFSDLPKTCNLIEVEHLRMKQQKIITKYLHASDIPGALA
jgi:hypothetical protein